MNLKSWLIGCLNSGLEQGSKLALVILSAFTVGQHLDIATLGISVSVGFLFGVAQWVYLNKLPDDSQPRLLKWLPKENK